MSSKNLATPVAHTSNGGIHLAGTHPSRFQDNDFAVQIYGHHVLKYNRSGDYLYFDKNNEFVMNVDPARYGVTPKLPPLALLHKRMTTMYRASVMYTFGKKGGEKENGGLGKSNSSKTAAGPSIGKSGSVVKLGAAIAKKPPGYKHPRLLLRWTPLRPADLAGSMWETYARVKFGVSEKRIDALFSLRNTDAAEAGGGAVSDDLAAKKVCILPEKRKFAASILIAGLKMSAEDVVRYVAGADPAAMEEDTLWALLAIAPDAEEENLLRSADGFGLAKNIDEIDAFMLKLARVDALRPKIESLLTAMTFQNDVRDILRTVEFVETLAREVMQSKQLKTFMRYALEVHNYIAAASGKENAAISGFKVDALEGLDGFRSTLPGHGNLLEYLADGLHQAFDGDDLEDGLKSLSRTKDVDLNAVSETIDGVAASLENVKNTISQTREANQPGFGQLANTLDQFLTKASRIQAEVDKEVSNMRTNLALMMQFFGEKNANSAGRQARVLEILHNWYSAVQSAFEGVDARLDQAAAAKTAEDRFVEKQGEVTFRALHFAKLTEKQLESTAWEKLGHHCPRVELCTNEIDALFGMRKTDAPAPAPVAQPASSQTAGVEILDGKRKHLVSILISSCKATPEVILSMINDAQFEKVSVDLLKCYAEIAPSPEEQQLLLANGTASEATDSTDEFLKRLASVPNLRELLKTAVFTKTFGEDAEGIVRDSARLLKASTDVVTSRALTQYLLCVLEVGNVLNRGMAKLENCEGYKIDAIAMLANIRSTSMEDIGSGSNDCAVTLLEFAVKTFLETCNRGGTRGSIAVGSGGRASSDAGGLFDHVEGLLAHDRLSVEALLERKLEFDSALTRALSIASALKTAGQSNTTTFQDRMTVFLRRAERVQVQVNTLFTGMHSTLKSMMAHLGLSRARPGRPGGNDTEPTAFSADVARRYDDVLAVVRMAVLEVVEVLDSPYLVQLGGAGKESVKVARASVFIGRKSKAAAKSRMTVKMLARSVRGGDGGDEN